jgi:signal recognition particle subunit SRP54
MFDHLTQKFHGVFSKFAQATLTEGNIEEAMRDIRMALLDADVNFSICSSFVKTIKEKALGQKVLKSVNPAQQFTKIVHDELQELLGSFEKPLNFTKRPTIILLCGLQGSGKTTFCAKLCQYIQKKHGKKILAVAADRQRPAAIEQLETLLKPLNIEVVTQTQETNTLKVVKHALKKAQVENFDVVVIDSAGRTSIDEKMMGELQEIYAFAKPTDTFFVANATIGQDAAKTAKQFNETVPITGSVLTMLDSNAKAGAALSIVSMTKQPIKFESVGEKIDDIQLFNPQSMADRILGMGDTINLVRKAEEQMDEQEQEEWQQKFQKADFTFTDYLKQMTKMKKMGSFSSLLKMLPGASMLKKMDFDDSDLKKNEAIIQSMSKSEKECLVEMIIPRRKRIAKGSGTSIDDVNRLIKGFKQTKDFLRKMPKGKKAQELLNKKLGDKLWQ